ncbi:hypothetical protein Tco_1145395 [Tanacetum coccineum]
MSSNTPDYIYPIIVPSDSNIDNAFSSTNSPDYTPALPDYFPASLGNTPSDFSDNLTKDLLALLAISPFYDDPYMKVMQAYNATSNETLIPPQGPFASPTVLPPSPMLPLSPMFDPQDFFLPEEILSPQKQAHFLSSSSTNPSAPPQAFEIEENYHGTEIEGHVDGRVIVQQDFDKLKTEHQEARAQIAGLQRKKMRHNDKITLARFRISTLELIIKDIQDRHESDMKSLFGYNP